MLPARRQQQEDRLASIVAKILEQCADISTDLCHAYLQRHTQVRQEIAAKLVAYCGENPQAAQELALNLADRTPAVQLLNSKATGFGPGHVHQMRNTPLVCAKHLLDEFELFSRSGK